MNVPEFIQNPYVIGIASCIGGFALHLLTQTFSNKRGTFTYDVNHLRVGMSADDKIFGSVAVSWNGSPMSNLYLSTVEMKNESMNDYDNVVINVYTDDTDLLTEQTQILGTPNILEWSEGYKNKMFTKVGSELSPHQWLLYKGQREYCIPVINRGQSVKLTYLNSPKNNNPPHIWLSATQKGVALKYRHPQNQILGVPQPRAAFVGLIICIIVVAILVSKITHPWTLAYAALTFGLIAQIPGAYTIKLWRKVREAIGG